MPPAEMRKEMKTCVWLYGESRAGKSTTARQKPHYLKLGNKWWDGYQHQSRVVLDDLGKEAAKALTDKIKLWADPGFNQIGETKGGAMLLDYDEFIVTSNYHPFDIWGNTEDYEPIMKRFVVSQKMQCQEEKADKEKDALEVMRNLNNKNGF